MAEIEVKATANGYYGHQRIRPGEVFTVKSEQELGSWMEPTNPDIRERHAVRVQARIQSDRRRGAPPDEASRKAPKPSEKLAPKQPDKKQPAPKQPAAEAEAGAAAAVDAEI